MKVTISNYMEVELGDDDTSEKLRQLSAEENKPLEQVLKDELFFFLEKGVPHPVGMVLARTASVKQVAGHGAKSHKKQ